MCCPCKLEENSYCFLFAAQGYLRWQSEVNVLKNLIEEISEDQQSVCDLKGVNGVVPTGALCPPPPPDVVKCVPKFCLNMHLKSFTCPVNMRS